MGDAKDSELRVLELHTKAKLCLPHRDDYMECLHGHKQRARYEAIAAEQAKQKAGADAHHHH
jgi:hypothetical protein